MPRAKNNVASRARRRKILKQAKGYWGARSKVYTIAKTHVEKGMQHAYMGRKLKKRNYRQLWIIRINAAARVNGTTYSRLVNAMNKKGIDINRKILATIAVDDPGTFAQIVNFAMN